MVIARRVGNRVPNLGESGATANFIVHRHIKHKSGSALLAFQNARRDQFFNSTMHSVAVDSKAQNQLPAGTGHSHSIVAGGLLDIS